MEPVAPSCNKKKSLLQMAGEIVPFVHQCHVTNIKKKAVSFVVLSAISKFAGSLSHFEAL